MLSRRGLILTIVVLSVLVTGSGLRAEVAAELDGNGEYLRTVILANASTKNVKTWSVQRSKPRIVPLNPEGDLNGDLWPMIRENPANRNHPWVVWSRSTGSGYDLGWSHWTEDGWSPLGWIEIVASPGEDDLDPHMDLDLDDGGRPYLVWWRDVNGVGEVYLSLYLESLWMRPYLVSDLGVDSRYPTVELADDGTILVTFETAEGPETRTILFNRPDTVHDDLDPIGSFHQGPPDIGDLGDGSL